MHTIQITTEKLRELAQLSDKQLTQQGYDPQSITQAATDLPPKEPKPKFFPATT